MSRATRFLKELLGPHVLFAFAAGVVLGWRSPLDPASPASWISHAGAMAAWSGFAAGAAAVLAKRLTANALVGAFAGALLLLLAPGAPQFVRWTGFNELQDLGTSALGLLAAGVRIVPVPALSTQRLLGFREGIAVAALLGGSWFGPAIVAMPFLILLADVVYAPVGVGLVLKRSLRLLPLHLAATVPGLFVRPIARTFSDWFYGDAWLIFPLAAVGVGVCLFRARIRQRLVLAVAFALAWAGLALLAAMLDPRRSLASLNALAGFGPALLIPIMLWRIAVAVTQPHHARAAEPPIPSVPALRDVVHAIRAEPVAAAPGGAPVPRPAESALGLSSTVETAVASAVAATLEQIRLAFRGRHPLEPAGTPEQVLWNRLLTASSGGVLPGEKPADALARWRQFWKQHLEPKLLAGPIICAGATPWPLAAAIAAKTGPVVLVERSRRTARLARADLAPVANVRVVRHDGRRLAAIRDGAAGAVIVLFEASRELPAEVVVLLRECRRVLRKGGVVAFGFADLALPAAQEALARGAPTEVFTVAPAVEALARLAGLEVREVASGVLPATSLAWLEAAS